VADRKATYQALASNSRLRILDRLGAQGEASVTELAGSLRMSQPLLSWHLAILRRAGLVITRRDGRVVRCSLRHEQFLLISNELRLLAEGSVITGRAE
jgi:DNA-binding transcriptional ArsR family regulator